MAKFPFQSQKNFQVAWLSLMTLCWFFSHLLPHCLHVHVRSCGPFPLRWIFSRFHFQMLCGLLIPSHGVEPLSLEWKERDAITSGEWGPRAMFPTTFQSILVASWNSKLLQKKEMCLGMMLGQIGLFPNPCFVIGSSPRDLPLLFHPVYL